MTPTPDAERPGAAAGRPFGVRQALWLPAGFLLIEIAIILLVLARHKLRALLDRALHWPAAAVTPDDPRVFLVALVVANAVAGLWAWRYVRRRAGPRLADGGPGGIGWRPAAAPAYAAAVLLAVALVGLIALTFHLVPPTPGRADALGAALGGTGGQRVAMLALLLAEIAVVVPFSEEFVFRGGMLAGLTGRFGAWPAGAAVTVVFVLLHAADKRGYPLGLLHVTLLAVAALWLRRRFGSLRPGMLLHALYNLGAGGCAVLAAAGLLR